MITAFVDEKRRHKCDPVFQLRQVMSFRKRLGKLERECAKLNTDAFLACITALNINPHTDSRSSQ